MKESLKKRIESIEKKEGSTEKFMYLCGIIAVSYTHLTLPTIRLVWVGVGVGGG